MREIFLEFVKIPAFKDIFMFFMPDEQTQIKAAFKGASVTIDWPLILIITNNEGSKTMLLSGEYWLHA